jgi:hypothetical protein
VCGVTLLLRVLGALVVAGVLAVSSSAAPSSLRAVAFMAVHGHGTVTSTPRGIHCPAACRGVFTEHAHVTFHARPAPGWTFGHFEGWCKSKTRTCGFDLVSPHDCIGGACPIGAFGSRAYFVRRQPST